MIRSLRFAAVLLALVTVSLHLGCGSGDECQKNGDCKDVKDPKNRTLVCRLQEGIRKCVPQTQPPTSNCPDTCADDLDCLNCEDGRTACIEGACAKPGTPPQCPSTCSSNSDCSQCPEGKTSCEGGTCAKPLVQCPTSCSSDSDCGSCDGGRTVCTSGACSVPQNTNCPTSCTSNSECSPCSNGTNYCVGGKCGTPPGSCPSACQTEGDCFNCPAGLTSCVNGRCTSSTQTCPSSCNSDAQCSPCPDGKSKCENDVCVNPSSNCPSSCFNSSQCGLCPDGRTECANGTCQKPTQPQCPSSCSTDSECSPCSGGRTSCVNGTCQVQNNPGCPSSCTTDSECGLCTGGRTACVSGTCQQPACPSSCSSDGDCANCPSGSQTCTNFGVCGRAQCPTSCSSDGDCGLCPNGRTECRSGTCQQPTQQCPSLCTRNSECARCPSGRTSCVGGRCTTPTGSCPSSCISSVQCLTCSGGRTSCVSGTCQAASQCPTTCSSDSQCANCPNGRTKCDLIAPGLGICSTSSSSGSGQVGDECAASTKPCNSGLLCVTISANNKSYCFQECQSASTCSSNSDGRTSCVPFVRDSNNQIRNVCLAERNTGQSCGFGVKKQQICKRNQDPALYCNKSGTCAAVVVQKTVGARCNKAGDTTEPIAICDEKSSLACDDATGKCVKATQVGEAQACDLSGSTLGKPTLCKSGFDCITFDTARTIGRCHKICQPGSSGACSHKAGTTCMRAFADGRGICMDQSCTSDSQCVFSNYRCQSQQSGGRLCVPTSDYGRICGNLVACKTGQVCITAPKAQDSFCSKTCTSSTTCGSVDGKSFSCITQSSSRFCLRRCTSNTDCPKNLTCQTIGTSKLCAAP